MHRISVTKGNVKDGISHGAFCYETGDESLRRIINLSGRGLNSTHRCGYEDAPSGDVCI